MLSVNVDMSPETRMGLERALAGPGLSMVFQPIFDLQARTAGGRTVVGLEALARFDIAKPPLLMFAAAEAVGLGVELETAALTAALDFLPELPQGVFLTVNASTKAVLSGQVNRLIAATASDRVVLDLVEAGRVNKSSLRGDFANLSRALSSLYEIGARVAMDDIAVSPVRLKDLVLLPFDFLKLDRTLVDGVDWNPDTRATVKALAELADTMGVSVIAEGIETRQELDSLLRLGIRYGQGYLLGRPERFQTWT